MEATEVLMTYCGTCVYKSCCYKLCTTVLRAIYDIDEVVE